MKLFALSEDTLNKTLGYLASKPFAEVTGLISLIQKAQLVVDGDGKAVEVPDAPVTEATHTQEAAQSEATA